MIDTTHLATGLGDKALFNSNGDYNTGLGYHALEFAGTGDNNTATGALSLSNNSTGSNNTANGAGTLLSNYTGSNNTAVGFNVLGFNEGAGNTGVGASALSKATGTSDNTAVGYNAMLNATTGSQNTAIGMSALQASVDGFFNVAVGNRALKISTSGQYNLAVGYGAGSSNTTGSNNTAVGPETLLSNSTGSSNTAIGGGADTSGNLTNATAIGAFAVVNASNKVRLGDSHVTVIEGQVAYTFTSDRNQKENFRPLDGESVLKKIAFMPVTSWNYIGQDAKAFRHYGPMSQDFYAAFGHDEVGASGTDTTINSGDVSGVLLSAVKALEKRTADLQKENEELRQTLDAIRASLVRQQ